MAIENYRKRTGRYPERVLVDQIYRNQKNRAYCKSKKIRISGKALGDLQNTAIMKKYRIKGKHPAAEWGGDILFLVLKANKTGQRFSSAR